MEENVKSKKKISLLTFIIVSVAALFVGAGIMFLLSITGLFTPTEIMASVNGEIYSYRDVEKLVGNYLSDIDNMKLSLLLDSVDYEILNKEFPLSKEEKEELESYIPTYVYYYGLTEDYARQYLTISKLRDSYFLDYLSQFITDEDISNYYENEYVVEEGAEKPALDDNLKEEILTILSEEYAENNIEDDHLFSNLLIELRNKHHFEIFDSNLKKAYDEYCNPVEEEPEISEENEVETEAISNEVVSE